MNTLLGTALVLASLVVLIYPFVNRRRYAMAGDPQAERLRVARMRVYRQITDLEGDFQTGDLTEEDYDQQMRELRIAAARILQREEQLGLIESDRDALEREIEAARKGMSGPPEGGDTIS